MGSALLSLIFRSIFIPSPSTRHISPPHPSSSKASTTHSIRRWNPRRTKWNGARIATEAAPSSFCWSLLHHVQPQAPDNWTKHMSRQRGSFLVTWWPPECVQCVRVRECGWVIGNSVERLGQSVPRQDGSRRNMGWVQVNRNTLFRYFSPHARQCGRPVVCIPYDADFFIVYNRHKSNQNSLF